MTAANLQIVQSFDELNMTPEQIAEDTGFDLVTIKSILTQFSSIYRKEMKTNVSLQYNDDEAQEAKSVILNCMRYAETPSGSEDFNLKFKAACRVVDEKQGRLDIQKQMQGININVLQFNQQLEKARMAKERTLSKIKDIEEAKSVLTSKE
jgi:hypothetical protein